MNDAKTIGSNALVLDTAEENVTVMNAEESKLGKEVSLIEQRAEAVVVASGADFEDAGLFLKQIKQAQKQVKDYWEPLRVSAKKSYDEVLAHRKEMIEPLEKAEKIENYYGLEQPLSGKELYERGISQAEALGVRILDAEVLGISGFDTFTVKTTAGDFDTVSVILATGGKRSAPKIPGLKEFEGRGVSYCAVCDAFFYRGKEIGRASCRERV